MRRRLSIIGFLAGLAMLVGTLPAYAAPRTLVALGDSYGSGVGSYIYLPRRHLVLSLTVQLSEPDRGGDRGIAHHGCLLRGDDQ